jgi:hypothetical protein
MLEFYRADEIYTQAGPARERLRRELSERLGRAG